MELLILRGRCKMGFFDKFLEKVPKMAAEKYFIALYRGGMNKDEAINRTADKFNMDREEVRKIVSTWLYLNS